MSMRISVDALVRLSWIMSAAVLVGVGVGIVWWPGALKISELRQHARSMYERANRNEAIVERGAALRRIQRRVERDVRRLSGRSSMGAVTAATIALLNGETRRFHVSVQRIAPDATSATATDPRAQLEPYDLEIGLRGHFGDILALVSDLPRHDVMLGVSRVDLKSLDHRSSEPPELNATLHATVYRLRAPLSAEVSDATSHL